MEDEVLDMKINQFMQDNKNTILENVNIVHKVGGKVAINGESIPVHVSHNDLFVGDQALVEYVQVCHYPFPSLIDPNWHRRTLKSLLVR